MTAFPYMLWHDLSTAEFRPGMNRARNERFNVMLRLISYGVAAGSIPFIVVEPGRLVFTLAAIAVVVGRCLHELSHDAEHPPGIGMFLDLVVAPMVTWAALGTPVFAVGLALGVALLMHISLRVSPRVLVVGAAAGIMLAAAYDALEGRAAPQTGVTLIAWSIVSAVALFAAAAVWVQWKQVNIAFASSTAELSTVLDNAPVMLLRVSAERTLINASGSVGPQWQVGENVDELFPMPLREMLRVASTGVRGHGDIAFGSKLFEVTCQPIGDDFLITGFDITERHEARAELEGLIRTKDEFVASISHELRTPLTAVLGFSQELQRMGAVNGEGMPFLETVVDQSIEMAAIIEDLLVAVRDDLDIFTVVERPVRLDAEVDRVVLASTPRIQKRIHVDSVEVDVVADGERVRQIVRNLLTNADKHGGPRVSVSVNRKAHVGTVCVRDDGPLIPEDRQRIMFEPFESSARVQGRTVALGLGLSVSRRLAELMGGRLTYGHLDGWSTFTLELPLAHSRELDRTA